MGSVDRALLVLQALARAGARGRPLADLAGLDSTDMGRVLASFRPWPTGRFWLVKLGLSALFGLVSLLPFVTAWAVTLSLLIGQWGTLLIWLVAGVVDRVYTARGGG